jgi:hypothetical protein
VFRNFANKIQTPGNHTKEKIRHDILVTKPIFTEILLAQQIHLKKLCAESHEYAADLMLTLRHEQIDRLVDGHDIHTKCSFYYA